MLIKIRFFPFLKDFLCEKKEIYTVRKYKMDERDVEIVGVGICRRIPLGEVTDKAQLLKYTPLSGFPTLQDWWNKIQQFIPYTDDKMYLYHVTLTTLLKYWVICHECGKEHLISTSKTYKCGEDKIKLITGDEVFNNGTR